MKAMISKFPGTCCECSKPINRGVPIRYFGYRRAAHLNCYNPEGKTESQLASERTAPCWTCGDPNGRFRNLGAATPVWCDACHGKEMAKIRTTGNVRFRDCSAEDSCCGAAAYEDRCREACGL